MSSEQTQHQSDDERQKARDLSLKPSRPPGLVPGYSIQQFIGSGAYGEVWSGTDKKTGRRVAVKFYTRRASEDVRQLAREVEKLVVLAADRYVVQLIDVGWDADPPYFVMDYIEHGSLEDRLKDSTTLPVDDAVEMFREIATGMMHLHGKGILHCDLKPGNVLLDQDGVPRLADFGQARLKSDKSASLGTLFYMAPEQADLDAIPDARWDVYSLGSLLYAMLCGCPPFFADIEIDSDSNISVSQRLRDYQQKISAADKPTAHRKIAGVDRALADIIDRAIHVDPKRRFASVQGLLMAMRQREIARARRPLLVLGLLGPLLLLGVMSLFAYSAHKQAVSDADAAIFEKARETNEFAAKLAARSAAEQIDEYFRAVRYLATKPSFLNDFSNAIQDPDLESLRLQLVNPSDNSDASLMEVRQELICNKTRLLVEEHLAAMLNDQHDQFPKAASWFVCDRWGNQLASKFAGEDELADNKSREKETRGNNYSYRTYFTGLDRDAKSKVGNVTTFDVTEDPNQRRIIDRPHLSAVFLSDRTRTWKGAFTIPIMIKDEIAGIIAVTAEMGSFVDFQNSENQHAMLIDGRDGEFPGVVLEHPAFDHYTQNAEVVPQVIIDPHVLTDLQATDSEQRFEDPLKDEKHGEEYDRDWIAAVIPVTSLDYSNQSGSSKTIEQAAEKSADEKPANEFRKPTGLYVLAAEDFESIIEPVHDLSRRLAQLAILATVFLLLVSIAMWLFVMRMLKESRTRLGKAFSPSTDSSVRADLKTMDLANQKTD